MYRPYQNFTSLIVLVAVLALVGGVAIVLATSGDSLSFAPGLWFGDASPAPSAAVAGSPTETPEATATEPAPATEAPPATSTPSPTEAATETPVAGASAEVLVAETALPEGVTGIAEVVLQGVAARLRDAPGGTVIGALLRGTQVQLLEGREVQGGITWVQVRDSSGLTGWMAEDLLQIVEGTGPAASTTPTLAPGASLTPLPTLPGGVVGQATVSLDSGTAGRLRDAPAGRVIGGVLDGTVVQVLQGREVRDGITWIEIRDPSGLTGWMSADLLDVQP
jgi:hypothetical protein